MALIGQNEELHRYVMYAPGISRRRLNVMAFTSMFIFGWLLETDVFRRLGKKGYGWCYIIPALVIAGVAKATQEPAIAILVLLVCLAGCTHANRILTRYQNTARRRLAAIDAQQQVTADELVERGLLYWVLSNRQSAKSAFDAALAAQEGGTPAQFNRAGLVLVGDQHFDEALVFFNRALSMSTDSEERAVIEGNRVEAELRKRTGTYVVGAS